MENAIFGETVIIMKLSENQKTIAKNYLVYSAGYMVVYPLIKWFFDKEFSWDIIFTCLATVLIVGILNLLLIIGARNPKE